MARILKTAIGQLGAINLADSRQAVVARLVEMMREAKSLGARFIVYPELGLTTFFPRYLMNDPADVDAYFEKEMPSAATKPLFDAAVELEMGFHLGYAELTPEGRHFNTAILVGPDGKIIGKYRKIHLPGTSEPIEGASFQHLEKRYFEVGDLGWSVWNAMGGNIGMCICNDRRWPETYRVMGLQSVEMVVLGYNTPTDNIYVGREPEHLRMFHHRLSLQAGAYQNATWVVASAKAGFEDGHGLFAGSAIVSPNGEIVAQTVTEEDEVVVYPCDLDMGADLKKSTFDFKRHRRPEHYRMIIDRVGAEPPGQ